MRYISAFVRNQRRLTARIFKGRLVWNSAGKNTYVRKIHGELL